MLVFAQEVLGVPRLAIVERAVHHPRLCVWQRIVSPIDESVLIEARLAAILMMTLLLQFVPRKPLSLHDERNIGVCET